MKKLVAFIVFSTFYTVFFAQDNQTNKYNRQVFDSINPYVHDPVLAKDGDVFYVFSTGTGISVMSSKDLKTWRKEKSIFKSAPEWTKEALPGFNNDIWAPDITYYKGNYHLFYSCNALPGKPHAAIGHATNPTLNPESKDFKWTDHGKIVQSILNRDMWQAIDPNVIVDEEGMPWLAFGSFWDGIKLVKLTDDMSSLKWPQDWHSIARRPSEKELYEYSLEDSQIEAAFIYKHSNLYYLFVSFDMCCRGVNSDYKIAVGRSKTVTGPYIDKVGFPMLGGGGTVVSIGDGKKWAALGHNSVYEIEGKDYMFAHGYSIPDNGEPKLIVSEIKWDKNDWPIIDLNDRITK
ncbi:arabinan endo-1,5-alpha-L-arabinosidase [Mariniflexile sp.]|uniref:arabinan endo-1,5-alpha-L-arabinosidase n=1 Tax=Mariniflexile sp. TaxID=1979402 RepID=UPI004047D4F7